MNTKNNLRNYYLKMRAMKDFKQNQTNLTHITENFLKVLKLYQPHQEMKPIIAGYLSIEGELDLSDVFIKCERLGYPIAMPVIIASNQPLKFRLCGSKPLTSKNKYYNKVYEPDSKYKEVIPSIIITPLLVCDYQGHRLGYGKGFYDRTLSYLRKLYPNLIAIGICVDDFLIKENLPFETHDQSLDIIITDHRIITNFINS